MLQGLLFIIGSIFLVYVSRSAFTNTTSHGFSRFLAWEVILALFVINVKYWFEQPLAVFQLVSWILLFVSLALIISGLYFLAKKGNVSKERKDSSLYRFEKTTDLVTSGVYHYIRHPMYSSLLFLTWGIACKQLGVLSILLALVSSFLLWITARRDENECIQFFGIAYQDYMKVTKRFVPFIF